MAVTVYSPTRPIRPPSRTTPSPIRPTGTLANAGTARAITNPRPQYTPQGLNRPNVAPRINVPNQPYISPTQPFNVPQVATPMTGTPADQLLARYSQGQQQDQRMDPFGGGWFSDIKGALGVAANSAPGRAVLGALDLLSRPRRAVLSTIHEISDAVGSGSASWDDWLRQFNDPNFGVGQFVDTGNWVLDDTIGFLGDVLLDPLTYVSGSGVLSGVGREARLAAARAATGAGFTEDIVNRIGQQGIHFLDDAQRELLRTATNEAGEHIGVNLLDRGYYFRLPHENRIPIPGTSWLEPYVSSGFGRVRTGLARSGLGSYLRSRVATPVGLQSAVERLVTGRGEMSASEAAERLNFSNGVRLGRNAATQEMREGARVLVRDTPGGSDALNAMINVAEREGDTVVNQYFDRGADIFEREGGTFTHGRRARYVPHYLTPEADAARRGLDPTSEAFLNSTIRGTSAEDESARLLEREIQPNSTFKFNGRDIVVGDDVTIDGLNEAFARAFPEAKYKLFEDNFETIAARYSHDLGIDAGQLRGWKTLINSRSGLVRSLDDVSDWIKNETQTALRFGELAKETEQALSSKRDYVAQLRQAQRDKVSGIQGILGIHMHEALSDLRTVTGARQAELVDMLHNEQRVAQYVESQGDRIPTGVPAGTPMRRGEVKTLTEGMSDADIKTVRAAAKARATADAAAGVNTDRVGADYVREEVARFRGVQPESTPGRLEERLNQHLEQLNGRAAELDAQISANAVAAQAERSQYNAERARLRALGQVHTSVRKYRALQLEQQLMQERAAVTLDQTALENVRNQLVLTRTKERILERAVGTETTPADESLLNLLAGPGEAKVPPPTPGEVRHTFSADPVTGEPLSQETLMRRGAGRPMTEQELISAGQVSGTRSTFQVRMEAATDRDKLILGVGDRALADTNFEMREKALELTRAETARDNRVLTDSGRIATAKEQLAQAESELAKVRLQLRRMIDEADPTAFEKKLELTRKAFAMVQEDGEVGIARRNYQEAQRALNAENAKVDKLSNEMDLLRSRQLREARQWDEAGNAQLIDPNKLGRVPKPTLPMTPQQEAYATGRLRDLTAEARAFDASAEGQALTAAQRELDEVTNEVTRLDKRVRGATQGPNAEFTIDDAGNITRRGLEGEAVDLVEQRTDLAARANVAKTERDAARALMAKGERGMLSPDEMAHATARYNAAADEYNSARRQIGALNSKLRRRGFTARNMPVPERIKVLGETVLRDAAALDGLRARSNELETFIAEKGLASRTRDMNIEVLNERLVEQHEAQQAAARAAANPHPRSLEDQLAKINSHEALNVAKSRNFGVPMKYEWEPVEPINESGARAIAQERQAMGRLDVYSAEDRKLLADAYEVRNSTPRTWNRLEDAPPEYQQAIATIKEITGDAPATMSNHQAAALSQYAAIRRRIAEARAGTFEPSDEFTAGLKKLNRPRGGNTKIAGRVQTALEAADTISDTQVEGLVTAGHLSQAAAEDFRETAETLRFLGAKYSKMPSPPLYRDLEYLISKSSMQSGTINGLHLATELGIEPTDAMKSFLLLREAEQERSSIMTRLRTNTKNIASDREIKAWGEWEDKSAEISAEITRNERIEAEQLQIKKETGSYGDPMAKKVATQRLNTLRQDLMDHQMKYPQFGAHHDAINMLAAVLEDDFGAYHKALEDDYLFSHLRDALEAPAETRRTLGARVKYDEMNMAEARAEQTRLRRAIDKARSEGRTTVRYSPRASRQVMFLPELESALEAGQIPDELKMYLQLKVERARAAEAALRTRRDAVPEYLARDYAKVRGAPPPGPLETTQVPEIIRPEEGMPDLSEAELWTAVRGERIQPTPNVQSGSVRLFTPDRSGYVDVDRAEFFRLRVRNSAEGREPHAIPPELEGRIKPYVEPPEYPIPLDREAQFGQTLDTRPLQGPMPAREVKPTAIGWDQPGKGKLKEITLEQAEATLKFNEKMLNSKAEMIQRNANTLSVLNGTAQRDLDAVTAAITEQVNRGVPDPEHITELLARRHDLQTKFEMVQAEMFGDKEMIQAAQDDGMQLLAALTSNDPAVKIPVQPKHLPILRDLFGGMIHADVVATVLNRMDEIIEHHATALGGGRALVGNRAFTDLQAEFDDFIAEVRQNFGNYFGNSLNDNLKDAFGELTAGNLNLDIIGKTREYMYNYLAASAGAAKDRGAKEMYDQLKLLGVVTGDTSRQDIAKLGFHRITDKNPWTTGDRYKLRKFLMDKFVAMGVDVRNALPDMQDDLQARLAQLQMVVRGLGGKVYPSEINDPEWLFTALRAQSVGLNMEDELKLFERFNLPPNLDDVQTRQFMLLKQEMGEAIKANDDAQITAVQTKLEQFLGTKPREGSTAAREESHNLARAEVARKISDTNAEIAKIDPQVEAIDNLHQQWGMTLQDMIDDPSAPKAPKGYVTRAEFQQARRDMTQAADQATIIGGPEAEEVALAARDKVLAMRDALWEHEPDEYVERANALYRAMEDIRPSSGTLDEQRTALIAQRDALASQVASLEAEGRLIPPPGSLTEAANLDAHQAYQDAVDAFNERMATYPGGADSIPAEEIPVLNQLAERVVEQKQARDADVAIRFAESMETDPRYAVRQSVLDMSHEQPNVNLDWETVFMNGIASRNSLRGRMDASRLGLMRKSGNVMGDIAGEQLTPTARTYLRNTIGAQERQLNEALAPIEEARARATTSLAATRETKAGLEAEQARLAGLNPDETQFGPELDAQLAAAGHQRAADLENQLDAARAEQADDLPVTAEAIKNLTATSMDERARLAAEGQSLTDQRQAVYERITRVQNRYTRELQQKGIQLGDVRANIAAVQADVTALEAQTSRINRAINVAPPSKTAELHSLIDDLREVNKMRRTLGANEPVQGVDAAMAMTESLIDSALDAQLHLEDQLLDMKQLETRLAQFADGSAQIQPVMTRIIQDGWTQMAKGIIGEDGVAVADGLAKSLKTLSEALRQPESWKLLDQYTQFFKTYATMTPGFHVRNAMSGVFMNYVDGVKTSNMARAIPLWRAYEDNPFQFFDSLANRADGANIRKAFDVVFGSGAGGQFTEQGLGDAPNFLSSGYRRMMNNSLTKWNRKAGSYVEGSLRLGMALDSIEHGASIDQALGRVTKFHFDYTQVSQLDRTAKRFIPFWTFISRNIPLQIEQMWMRPRAYLIYQSFVRNFGNTPDPFTPDYWLNQGAFTLDANAANRDAPWYLAPDLPFTRITEPIDALMEGNLGKAILSDVNPLFMAPIEAYGAHQKFYTGQPIEGYSAPGGAMAWLTPLFQLLGQTKTGGTTGDTLVANSAQHMARSLLPPLNLLERLTSGTGVRAGREDETLYRALGAPVYQLTDAVRQSTRNTRAAARRNARDAAREIARS